MNCPRCGKLLASTDPADRCPSCGAPIDWREPRSPDVVDNDDEEVIENAGAVEPPRR